MISRDLFENLLYARRWQGGRVPELEVRNDLEVALLLLDSQGLAGAKQDRALNAAGHAHCWDWIDGETTLFMVPDAGHWVHRDAPQRVRRAIVDWLRW